MAERECSKEVPAEEKQHTKDLFGWVQQKAVEAQEKIEQRAAENPVQMFLPGFDIGAMPNHLNRSSFISPIARGKRKFHRQIQLISRADCILEYTGEQLDEADGDLVMALIFFAQPYPLGVAVPLNRAKLLQKLGRSTGKTQYEWLHRRLKALREGVLFLEAKKPDGSTRYKIGNMQSFNILKELNYAEEGEDYTYTLDPRWVTMFSNREYALLDWDKRMQIGRGQDMAKALQRLVATSSNPVQHYALDWLKDKMQYTSPMRKFRETLESAVRELVRLEIIAKGVIEKSTKDAEQLTVWLTHRHSVPLSSA